MSSSVSSDLPSNNVCCGGVQLHMSGSTITPKEYAAEKGISLQAVTAKLRKGKALDGVKRVKKYSRFYVLEMK